MARQTSGTPNENRDESAYPDTDFIGYKQQLDDFRTFLTQWKKYMTEMRWDNGPQSLIPTANNKLPGLLVMLFGHGGLGKSMLLNRYRNIALEANGRRSKIQVGSIIDAETIINRPSYTSFDSSEAQIVDPISYYDALASAVALALGKKLDNCKHFRHARKIVSKVQKKAEGVLREMNQEKDRFGILSDLTIESATALIRSYFPLSVLILDHPDVKNATEETKKLLRKNLAQMKDYLRVRLDDTLCDYINPELRLGPALGEDLRDWAKNYPLLILFDSYEEIDESDTLLRIVMSAGGPRVGWVLTGKSNLWDVLIHIEHNPIQRYSYKEIVQPDLGFSVNFNSEKVGAFSPDDIIAYFTAIRERIPEFANLPSPSSQDATRILAVTQGVPLAVKLAAELFYETGSVNAITDKVEGTETILDQMVNRYLLHTHANQSDCLKLYGIAMLRRADQPHAIVAALELTPVEAEKSYRRELSHLHRHYSSFFTEKNDSSLHPYVRQSFRRWLLKRRTEPEIVACCKRLLHAQEDALKALEEQRPYTSLQERLQDDEWASGYLDLIEQQFWSDPVSGLKYLLSFMLATAIYRHNANSEALEMGEFFSTLLREPYRNWWPWVNQSLIYFTDHNLPFKELDKLKHLEILIKQRSITFPSFISVCTDELGGVLMEHLGKIHAENESKQENELHESASLEYFRRVPKPDEGKNDAGTVNVSAGLVNLPPEFAHAYNDGGIEQAAFERYEQAIGNYDKAIELDSNFAVAYHNRGLAHAALERYEQAIGNYDKAIELDSNFAVAYHNRGLAHAARKDYDEAIADYTQVITLDPTCTLAYYNRGEVYTKLKQFELADADYCQAIDLDPNLVYNSRVLDYLKIYQIIYATTHHNIVFQYNPNDINAAWVWFWGNMGKQRFNETTIVQLENIAQIDVVSYVGYICRGISLALSNKLKEGLEELETAIQIEPEQSDAYFWKGILRAYYYRGRFQMAIEAIQKALEAELLPTLLTPLYWLETDLPEFFEQYARPLLEQYGV